MFRTGIVFAALVCAGAYAGDVKGDPYTLNICAVSGEELGSMGEAIVGDHEGREVKFCCSGCPPRLKAEASKYLSEVDAQMIEAQKAYYPLKTDVVSGKELGDTPMDKIYKNRLVRFASEDSFETFKKDPAQYWGKLDEAVIAAQKEKYALKTCVTSDEELGSMGEPENVVIANRLVMLCCAGCEKAVFKDPLAAFKKIDAKK